MESTAKIGRDSISAEIICKHFPLTEIKWTRTCNNAYLLLSATKSLFFLR